MMRDYWSPAEYEDRGVIISLYVIHFSRRFDKCLPSHTTEQTRSLMGKLDME